MKKNTVITIVIAMLLCVVLLGAADGPRRIVSPVASKYMTAPQSVTFITENSKTTVFVEQNGHLTTLPALPEDEDPNHEWNWIIEETSAPLSTSTVIDRSMTVHAVMTDNTPKVVNDPYDGLSGVLVTKSADNGNKKESAVLATSLAASTGLDACFEGDSCSSAPLVWTLSRVADKACVTDPDRSEEEQCFYTVQSSAGYLNISKDSISISGYAQPIRIAKRDIGFSLMTEDGKWGLSFKYQGVGKIYWFKPTDNSQYYKNQSVKFYFDSADKFVSQLFTITFNTKGGNLAAPQPMKANNGGQITLPGYGGTLSRHNFDHWTDGETDYEAGTLYTVNANKTLYAVYDNTTHYIWLDGNGGSYTGNAFYEISGENAFAELPEATGRNGYKFIGWVDDQGTLYQAGENNFANVNSDITLKALWHKVSKVSFVTAQSGEKPYLIDIEEYPSVYLNADNTYLKNGEAVTSPDFEFYPPSVEKWMYFDNNGYKVEIDVTANPVFEVPAYNVTLFEIKSENQKIKVTFNLNGGEISGETAPYVYDAENTEEIVLNTIAVSRENYVLEGWKDAFGYFYPADGLFPCRIDETLTAVWGYTVKFDTRGGTVSSWSKDCTLGEDCTIPAYSGTRNGNDFLGWITSETYNKEDVPYQAGALLEDEETGEARAFQYYALYKSTITFDTNGGGNLYDLDGNSVSKTVKNNQPWSTFDLSNYTPVKNVEESSDSQNTKTQIGKREFLGWAVSKSAGIDELISSYEVTGELDQTLYAIWGSKFLYYIRGANDYEDQYLGESEAGIQGVSVDLKRDIDNSSDANFKGWTDGKNQYSLPNLNTTYRQTNTKLYAMWDKDVTIKFNVNGGTGSVSQISAKVGDEITFPSYDGSKSGHKFMGWTDGNNLLDSSYHRIYETGEKYFVPLTSGANITFYAAWTPDGEEGGEALDQVRFGIRLDGTIPKEPGNYKSSDYTSRKGIDLGNFFDPQNTVLERKWVADNDPDISHLNDEEDVNGITKYYIVNAVTNAVTILPSAQRITEIMRANGKDFNPATQYVLWYVLKWQGKTGNQNIWHVDGVVLNKEMATVIYDYNCDPVKKVNGMPRGFQAAIGSSIVVGFDDGKWMEPYRENEAGIHFKGWSLVQNPGPGDTIYSGDSSEQPLTLTQPVTTLYAQWETSYVDVKFYKEWENDSNSLVQALKPTSILMTLEGIRTDGSVYQTKYYSVTAKSEDADGKGWYVKADNLPVYDAAGNHLTWTWSEGTIPHFKEILNVQSEDGLTTTITNRLVTTAKVTKVWNDENDNDGKRPSSVSVQLYKYTDDENSKTAVGEPVSLNEANSWTYTERDLPVLDGDKPITYTWDEVSTIEGYEKEVGDPTGDYQNGWNTTIKNTHKPETAPLKVVMIWDDKDAEKPRPNAVTLTLTGTISGPDGSGVVTVYGPKTYTQNKQVSEEMVYQWDEFSTESLRVYNSGKKISYTWSETVPGSYDHNAEQDVVTDSEDETLTKITNHRYVVTVTPDNKSKEYGAKDPELTATVSGLKGNDTLVYTLKRDTGENVGRTFDGEKWSEPSAYKIKKNTGNEEQGYYHVIYQEGNFKITPAKLTVTAVNNEKEYGDPDPSFSANVTGMKKSELSSQLVVPSVTRKGSNKDVGTYEGVIVPSGPAAIENYDISYVNGAFTITPAKVTVKADDKYKIYGQDDKVETAVLTATITGLKNNEPESVIDVSLSREQGEMVKRSLNDLNERGEYTKDPDAYVITAAASNTHNTETVDGVEYSVQGNYLVKYETGNFVINPVEIQIKGKNDSKVYDGTALTFESTELNKDGIDQVDLLRGDELRYVKVSGSRTVFGDSENTPQINTSESRDNIQIMNGNVDVTHCYNITSKPGTLTITKAPLTITAASDTKVYDGKPLTKDAYTNTDLQGKDSIESVTITGSVLGSRDKETSGNNIASSAKITHPTLGDVTGSYDITYNPGLLVVSPRPSLVITADSDNKTYDGTPLIKDTYTAVGLRDGDSLSGIRVTGSQTDAGTSANVVTGKALITNRNGDDVTGEYDINTSNGTLWVKPITLYLTASSAIKQVYDGTSLKDESFTYDARKLVAGDVLNKESVSVTGSRIQAGTTPNQIRGGQIVNASGKDVTGNYNIIHVDGTLTIYPRPVTVTVGAYVKSRGELDPEFTAAVANTVNGETVKYEITREEGEEPGQYAVTPSGDKLQGSYQVTYIPGTLTINFNAEAFTVVKVWDDDNNRDGIRPVSLGVSLVGSNGSIVNRRLSAENDWSVTITDMPVYESGVPVTYHWVEDLETASYEQLEPEVRSNTTILRNRHEIARASSTVTKVWEDKDNIGGSRPTSLRVILRANGATVRSAVLNEANGWSETVENLPMYENGNPIEYVWFEQSVGNGYYAVRSTTSGGNTTLVNSNLYTLTIHYRYNSGLDARPDYTVTLYSGETFSVDSPEIDNFTPSMTSVIGEMETSDLEFTVIYTTGGEAIINRDQKPVTEETEVVQKGVPAVPEQKEPDDEHPLVALMPNRLVDIDDQNTALGLGEVNSSNHGFALE
ncbi:MAG: Cna B-type domain-containing protein [Flexilinea sp.]|nr:Cna B-type domain-containing protein [Flexilinea sp.]